MPEPSAKTPPAPAPAKARRRPWWKKLLIGLAILLGLLIVFHRVLIFAAVKYAAHKLGPSQGLQIDFDIHGSIFGGLRIENLRAVPTRPGPVAKANVGLLEAHYSLWTLARHGLSSDFIQDVTLHDADIVYDPAKSPPSPPTKKEPFKLPPLPFPQRVSLRNVNFRLVPAPKAIAEAKGQAAAKSSVVPAPVAPIVAGATEATVDQGLLVGGFNLELDPQQDGQLRIGELRIPGGPDLHDVSAGTSYHNRNLKITDLALAREIRLKLLGIDASQLEKELLAITLDGELFGGTLALNAQLAGIGKPPKATVTLDAAGIQFGAVRDFLKLDVPLGGSLEKTSVRFVGFADQPRTWEGEIAARLDQPAAANAALDAVDVRLTLHDGAAELTQADLTQGANKAAVRAKLDLPAKLEDLPRLGGGGTLESNSPDFSRLPVKLPLELAGSLKADGDFKLADGKFTSNLKGAVRDFRAPQQKASVANLTFGAAVTKTLPADATAPPPAPNTPAPPPKPFYEGLQTRLTASVEQIGFDAYRIDGVKLTISTAEAATKLEQLEILRADNKISADGAYRIPADFAQWQQGPLALRLNVSLPDVSQFSADQAAAPLQGQFAAKGNLALAQGACTGQFDLNARNLQAKGAKVETADVQVTVRDNAATIHDSHIRFDAKNSIDLDGRAALSPPYPFEGNLNVNLTDLSSFAPLLSANGVNEKVGGALRIAGRAKGQAGAAPDGSGRQVEGSLAIDARDLQAKGAKIERVETLVTVQDNQAVVQTGSITLDAKSKITFGGQADLRAPHAYAGSLNVDLPDLAAFEPLLRANGLDEKLGGSISLVGKAQGSQPTTPGADDQKLDGEVKLTALNLQARGLKIERIDGLVTADKTLAVIKTFQIRFNGQNTIDLNGQAGTQAPHDYRADLTVNLADLKHFEALLRASAQKPDNAPGTSPAGRAETVVQGVRNPADLAAAKASAAQTAAAAGQRAADAKKRGAKPSVTVGEKKTPGVKPADPAMAAGAPAETKLAGALLLKFQAQGNLAEQPAERRQTGDLKLGARKVEFNAVGPLEADLAGNYAGETVDVPTIAVTANGLDLRATLGLKDGLLRLDNIHLRENQTELFAGYVQVPIDLHHAEPPGIGPIPDTDQIDVNIASKAISLSKVFTDFKKGAAPADGTVELLARVQGSFSKLAADVKVQARGLRSAQFKQISPADSDLTIALHDDRLTLDTVVRQPQIQPLTIKGNVPLPLRAVISNGQLDPKSPIALTVQLPRSSLGFLAKAVPGVRYIEGDAAIDVKVGGTVEKPVFSGTAQANIPAVRAQNITVPAVRDFALRLAFKEKTLSIERLAGEIGGGKFNVGGKVDFATLANPQIQLAAKADDVLALRDDTTTARVNADVKINGPLDGATVAGYVGITKSRYLKDIDIVPLNLPGKPAPQPPAPAAADPSIGIPTPPLSKWKLDLTIKTDDPFFVRGNLANGAASVNLHVGGTGAAPLLDGNVTVERLVASLPFSRLEIDQGNINFTSDQPLNPVVDMTGTSTIRNYLVTLYISGRAKDPKITFNSEPPLPQEQIVSLLATGSTTDELAGNSQALAGKATLLVLQDLYRRTFKKKAASRYAEPQETLADRVDLNIGDVDPQTGKQQVGGTFRITDTVQFVGDFGAEGNIRGRVKYLVRFR